jgi:OHCU decarboxylase
MLNAQPSSEFADSLRPLFETARPLFDALYAQRPFTSYAHLIDTAEHVATHFSREDQIATVNAHPRIGERTTSTMSSKEQGAQASAEVEASLKTLNDEYERRFGFRFVIFVNRRPRHEILQVLEGRLNNQRDQELHTALQETFLIARDRLRTLS